jgi:hypothetical protein
MLDVATAKDTFRRIRQASAASPEDEFLTPAELAARWKRSEGYLANLRYRGEGVPFVKTASGGVLYRMTDVVESERDGTAGITLSKIDIALADVPGMDAQTRKLIMRHLRDSFQQPRS